MAQAFPLSWPAGWKTTAPSYRINGRFSKHGNPIGVGEASKRIVQQLQMMGVGYGDVIISTNLPVRLDGLPCAAAKVQGDIGAAVYWRPTRNAPMRCMAIDQYNSLADNLAAIAATLEAMRAIERHGGAQILERAFLGFAALPERGVRPWREVLEVSSNNLMDVEERFRELAQQYHPDKEGGDRAKFEEIVEARKAARAELTN